MLLLILQLITPSQPPLLPPASISIFFMCSSTFIFFLHEQKASFKSGTNKFIMNLHLSFGGIILHFFCLFLQPSIPNFLMYLFTFSAHFFYSSFSFKEQFISLNLSYFFDIFTFVLTTSPYSILLSSYNFLLGKIFTFPFSLFHAQFLGSSWVNLFLFVLLRLVLFRVLGLQVMTLSYPLPSLSLITSYVRPNILLPLFSNISSLPPTLPQFLLL